jgi:hypothetical protein
MHRNEQKFTERINKLKLNSVASVGEKTIPTVRPPLVSEVSVSVYGQRAPRGQRDGSLRQYS